MKLWRGKKRLAKKVLGRLNSRSNTLIQWALTVKPGDYIATCEGCNRQVAKVEPSWYNVGQWLHGRPNKTYFLHEVVFTDTRGRMHPCPGGGCAYPAETPEEVTKYFREWAFETAGEDRLRQWYGEDDESADRLNHAIEQLKKFREALTSGQPIVDAHGELLPEFEEKFIE